MSAAAGLVAQLENSLKFFRGTLSVFDESDAAFTPRPGMFSVAAQVHHVAGTVEWFMAGAFGAGWDTDFDAHLAEAHEATSLETAVAYLERAYAGAVSTIEGLSEAELFAPIEDEAIMGGAPRAMVVAGINDHSAHHRGALAVYARLLGREPAMPYA